MTEDPQRGNEIVMWGGSVLCVSYYFGLLYCNCCCANRCHIPLQIISCLATLLRKQDLSVWSYPSTLQMYHGLLSLTVHSKPKVCLLDSHSLRVGMLKLIFLLCHLRFESYYPSLVVIVKHNGNTIFELSLQSDWLWLFEVSEWW